MIMGSLSLGHVWLFCVFLGGIFFIQLEATSDRIGSDSQKEPNVITTALILHSQLKKKKKKNSPLARQTLCILANIADGNTAKELIMTNDDMLQKIKYYMVPCVIASTLVQPCSVYQ